MVKANDVYLDNKSLPYPDPSVIVTSMLFTDPPSDKWAAQSKLVFPEPPVHPIRMNAIAVSRMPSCFICLVGPYGPISLTLSEFSFRMYEEARRLPESRNRPFRRALLGQMC